MSKSFRNHADWRRFVVSVNKDLVPNDLPLRISSRRI